MKSYLTFVFSLAIGCLAFSQNQYTKPPGLVFLCPPCGMDCDKTVHEKGGDCTHCGMRLIAGYPEMAGKSQRGHFQHTRGLKVAILVFEGVELIDFAPEFEIFGQAGMQVFTVSEKDTVIRAAFGLRMLPDYTFDNAPQPDILVLPGGHVDHENPKIREWVLKNQPLAKHTLSVCNGAYFLAVNGLLDGKDATTFNGLLNDLQQTAPNVRVVNDRRFVDNGNIITSAGLAAGIDAAFHVLGKYEGVGRAQEVATFLEYNWDVHGSYVRAQLADRFVRPIDDALSPFLVETRKYEGDRRKWVLESVVTTELIPIEKIISLINYQLSNGTPSWNQTSENGLNSRWKLEEPGNLHWAASLEVLSEAKNFLVKITVQQQ